MKLSVSILKKLLVLIIVPAAVLSFYFETEASGSKKDRYDIVYLVSENIERVLDYKDELDSIFENGVRAKIKVMGRGDEYALIYDGNDSARTVTKTLVKHAELLDEAGYDEPYATKDQNFQPLYNVSYGMGPNLDPLKKRYELIYSCLGEDVGQNLFIETTEYGNYTLIYRRRGSKRSTTVVARKHAKILRSKKISTSITRENNNRVVYGESSLMDETPAVQP